MKETNYEVEENLEEIIEDLNNKLLKRLQDKEIDTNSYDNIIYNIFKQMYEYEPIFKVYFKFLFADLQYLRWNDLTRYLSIFKKYFIVSLIEQLIIYDLLEQSKIDDE